MRPSIRYALSAAAICALGACSQTGGGSGSGGCAPGNPALAGHYFLNGVMEVGSEILLRPDGSFEFMLAYGALDQQGSGCWRVSGAMVELVPRGRSSASRGHTPESRGFGGLFLEISGRDLVWDIAGSGYRGTYVRGRG